MKSSGVLGLAVVAVIAAAGSASASSIILSPGSTWEYTFTDPTANPRWHWKGSWSSGPAPFGNCDAACGGTDFAYATRWDTDGSDRNDDLWLRRTIDLSGYALSTIGWGLGVDNGFRLYVNGHLVDQGNHEGYAYRWEYPIIKPQLIPASFLRAGTNVVSIAAEDHGGLTGFDMQINGDRRPAPVPEPATLALFGVGAIAALRRHSRRRS